MRFGHADTKTFHHEPAGRGQIGVERRGFGLLAWNAGGQSGVAGGRPLAVTGCGAAPRYSSIGRGPVWPPHRFARAPTQESDQV
jgi:hypothetical protein